MPPFQTQDCRPWDLFWCPSYSRRAGWWSARPHPWCHWQWPVWANTCPLSPMRSFLTCSQGHPAPIIYPHLICQSRQEHSVPFLCYKEYTILDLPASKAVRKWELPKVFLGKNRDKASLSLPLCCLHPWAPWTMRFEVGVSFCFRHMKGPLLLVLSSDTPGSDSAQTLVDFFSVTGRPLFVVSHSPLWIQLPALPGEERVQGNSDSVCFIFCLFVVSISSFLSH